MPTHKIAHIDELKRGRGIVRTVDGTDIALFSVDGDVFAVSNYCPHQHLSRLHESTMDGTVITCPMHGWSFDLRTGETVNAGGRLKKIPAELRGNNIYVTLDDTH